MTRFAGTGTMIEEIIDIDCMLHHVGNFGRFQLILMVLFSIINAFSAFHYFGQTFISVLPEFQCNDTNYGNVTMASTCEVSLFENDTYLSVECTNGWVFNNNNTYGFKGIVEEVCNNLLL